MSTLNGRNVIDVTAHIVDFTLTANDNGTAHTNTAATGVVVGNLPAATVGLRFTFGIGAAFALRINPSGSETISLPSNGVPGAAGKYLEADAVGESVDLICLVAGNWNVKGFTGTWSAEG